MLRKKCRELMSMIALNKADKERHLRVILKALWVGNVVKAIDYHNIYTSIRSTAEHYSRQNVSYAESRMQSADFSMNRRLCPSPLSTPYPLIYECP